MKKKALMFVLCLTLIASLSGCQSKKAEETKVEVETNVEEKQIEEPKDKQTAEQQTKEEETDEAAKEETSSENMIENGDFSQGVGTWMSYLNGGEATINVNNDGQFVIDISDCGNLDYSVQAYYDGFKLEEGVKYKFAFDLAVSKPRTFVWRVQLNGGDYHAYHEEAIAATTDMQHYEFEFTMEEPSDPAPRLCFNVGVYDGDGDLGQHEIYVDNLDLHIVDASGKVESFGATSEMSINVNQVGYQTADTKIAVFRGAALGKDFSVVDTSSNKEVFTGKLGQSVTQESVGEETATGDFTSVTTPGSYKIISGNQESAEFIIDNEIYRELLKDTVHMFALQRCGEQLNADVAGDFIHPACHTNDAVIYGTNDKKNVSGGWHDAGDYGRYVVAGAKAVTDLLLAYEMQPALFGDDFDMPQSENGQPDLLDEVKYELDWMLKMQDEKSGGVYHKVTCANFPGTVLPQDETEQLIISPISNCATGDFAAVMAQASRIYSSYDKAFADTCLNASKKALSYLEEHRQDNGFTNPSDIVTGEYGDGNCEDELFWALAELYKATNDSQYEAKIKGMNVEGMNPAFGWADVAGYAMQTYLSCEKKDSDLLQKVQNRIKSELDRVKKTIDEDAYHSSIEKDYPWGSNMTIANNGMLMLLGQSMNADTADADLYHSAAQSQLNYLLGTNANSYCFVTGYGSLSPEHTHHRPSQALGKTMKGMLVGGPNSNLEDPYAQATLSEKANAKRYVDNDQSYSCNEITIYWNSPLVNLLAGLITNNT